MNEVREQLVAACPACGSTAAPQVGGEAEGFDTVLNGEHFYQPPYVVRGCATCGLYFKSVTLSAAALHAYYAALDSAVFEIDADFPTDRILRRWLGGLLPGSRVLDFGCSTGRVLKEFTSRLTCSGVEPNERAAAVARARGIEIITAEQAALTEPFDAIVLTDVFEHLQQPVELVQMLASRLVTGGRLAIVTGNADAIASRPHFAEFWYFRMPGHLTMLSRRHLGWLSARVGLRLAAVYQCSHYSVPLAERLRQRLQAFAYEQFRSSPSGPVAQALRLVPRLGNVPRWTTAPALNYRQDHVVAFLDRLHQ
jgi:SAM-dependent methyltransferase